MSTAEAGEVRLGRGVMLLAASAFTLSGLSALVYQVSWQRILALHSGVGIYSVAIITGSFMAGLGTGSQLGGMLSSRVSAARALRVFAGLEAGIGAFAALSCTVFYDWLYLRASWLYGTTWRAALLHLAGLIVPTALMGMSLPFLVRALVRDAREASRTVAILYGVNVVGAAVGALLAPWVLIRLLGIRGAVAAGVAGNLAAAAAALLLGRLLAGWTPARAAPVRPAAADVEAPGGRPLGLWLTLYAASGFCALALEVLWFRITDVGVKATAFTFGTVLATYLSGLAGGSLVGARYVGRVGRPLRAFLLCQCALLAYAGGALVLLTSLPPDLPGYRWFFEYWHQRVGFRLGQSWDLGPVLKLYAAWPLALFGVPTILMGLSFPILQRAVHDDLETASSKVGLLQAANIAGCMAGSLVVGLWALDAFGTSGTLRALTLLGAGFAGVGVACYGLRSPFGVAGPALVLMALAMPGQERLWKRLHGLAAEAQAYPAEDATGVVLVAPRAEGQWGIWVNGRSHSWVPFGGVHTRLGALPALVHPAPVDVAVIGLGSGDTAWAAACRKETRRVVVFELCATQRGLLQRVARDHAPRNLAAFLDDGRIELVVADGRNRLLNDSRRYDIIEADGLHPDVAYSGNLYSLEFFALMGRRLKPGGVMSTWAPTPRVAATFARAFPHVLAFEGGAILVGSHQPLDVDVPTWTARLLDQHVRGYLDPRNSGDVFRALERGSLAPPSPALAPNRDLFPRDEFASP